MSRSYYVDYSFYSTLAWKSESPYIINALVTNGWTYYDSLYCQGLVRYVPLGDKDGFNRQVDMLTPDEVESLAISKIREGETVIIDFCKTDLHTGLTLHIWKDHKVSFQLNADLGMFAEGVPDVTWYLMEFKKVFDSIGLTKYIESIEYQTY